MGYKNLKQCVNDLERTGRLVRISVSVSADLEAGAIQRRVYQAKGPALLFTNIENCAFPALANLFGTLERTRFIFRDALAGIQSLMNLKADPRNAFKKPSTLFCGLMSGLHIYPKTVSSGPVLECETTVSKLPPIKSWPMDGGPFITLPQVYTENPSQAGYSRSNLGMYRIQLSGNDYIPDREVGLHYQIHRGIGVHHTEAVRLGVPFKVAIYVGGPPAMTLASVMPLPEGMPEIYFAGVLGKRRIRMIRRNANLPLLAEADFCIVGTIDPKAPLKPEGPFGDHLGFYSLTHDYPVLKVEKVYHRRDAIWPFTTVGRPPQEDTVFGEFIHELTRPVISTVLPGIHAVHAVDAAGVHPLMFAIGSERYTPYAPQPIPQEILTQANAILGQGQLSLTKYLFISNHADNPNLDINDVPAFFRHMLERVDLSRDLHFQTATTMDTLDYSGPAVNQGSKVVMAAVGPVKRELSTVIPSNLKLPNGFGKPRVALPGVLVICGPKAVTGESNKVFDELCSVLETSSLQKNFPLLVVVDDSEFSSRTLNNFLWVTFTRSDPAVDIHGVGSFVRDKHWGCTGPLIIDARLKDRHAPPLEDDPAIEKRVDALGAPGGPLYGVI